MASNSPPHFWTPNTAVHQGLFFPLSEQAQWDTVVTKCSKFRRQAGLSSEWTPVVRAFLGLLAISPLEIVQRLILQPGLEVTWLPFYSAKAFCLMCTKGKVCEYGFLPPKF